MLFGNLPCGLTRARGASGDTRVDPRFKAYATIRTPTITPLWADSRVEYALIRRRVFVAHLPG